MTNSKEFEEQKELIELKKSAELEKHKFRMKELIYSRESNKLFHEKELERLRIKSAEIKRSQQRKADMDFIKDQGRPHG